MQSVGSILANAGGLSGIAPAAPDQCAPAEPRLHKVTLCVQVFAEIEVTATTVEEAFEIADRRATEAKRTFKTAPYGFRAHIRKLIDARDPAKGFKWVEMVRDYLSPAQPEMGLKWVEKR